VGYIGFYTLGQPSITQVLTWFHSLLYEWKWELFLSDPFIFLFWLFIIITGFIWGRGLFCGWLCPYGSMTEMLYQLVSKTPLKRFQFSLPMAVHDYLKWVKYFVFAALLGISFYSMPLAEQMAEVEPFKTTFLVGVWNRTWPFAVFWLVLIVLALFTERPFCKYLCPLGASLAIPTTFRFFGLKRKPECQSCHACGKDCGSLAIDDLGAIDHRECMLCLDCMVMYYDDHACPPLSQERKRRLKVGQPLTEINAEGYFIPVEALQASVKRGG
jgi:NosR/NirI family nitrous oxide reductase transcriptional regulator